MNYNIILDKLVILFKYQKYLQVGVNNAEECFNLVAAQEKTSTDLDCETFFKQEGKDKKYDLIFLNRDFYHDQVFQDIETSLAHLDTKGAIIIANTLYEEGPSDDHPKGVTAWKAFASLRSQRTDLLMGTIEMSKGVSVIQRMSDFNMRYQDLPGRFNRYDRHGVVLKTATGSDSVEAEMKNEKERERKYCELAMEGAAKTSWDDDDRVHDRWLVNYFEDNYKYLMNSHPLSQFIAATHSCFQVKRIKVYPHDYK